VARSDLPPAASGRDEPPARWGAHFGHCPKRRQLLV